MILFSKRKMGKSPDIKYREAEVEEDKVNGTFTEEKFDSVISAMEKARLAEYATYMSHPFRLLGMNFLIGLARGLGSTIGLAVVLAVAGMLLKNTIYTYFPDIGESIQNILAITQSYSE